MAAYQWNLWPRNLHDNCLGTGNGSGSNTHDWILTREYLEKLTFKYKNSPSSCISNLVDIGKQMIEIMLWDERAVFTERLHEMWLNNIQALHVRRSWRYDFKQTLKQKTHLVRNLPSNCFWARRLAGISSLTNDFLNDLTWIQLAEHRAKMT